MMHHTVGCAVQYDPLRSAFTGAATVCAFRKSENPHGGTLIFSLTEVAEPFLHDLGERRTQHLHQFDPTHPSHLRTSQTFPTYMKYMASHKKPGCALPIVTSGCTSGRATTAGQGNTQPSSVREEGHSTCTSPSATRVEGPRPDSGQERAAVPVREHDVPVEHVRPSRDVHQCVQDDAAAAVRLSQSADGHATASSHVAVDTAAAQVAPSENSGAQCELAAPPAAAGDMTSLHAAPTVSREDNASSEANLPPAKAQHEVQSPAGEPPSRDDLDKSVDAAGVDPTKQKSPQPMKSRPSGRARKIPLAKRSCALMRCMKSGHPLATSFHVMTPSRLLHMPRSAADTRPRQVLQLLPPAKRSSLCRSHRRRRRPPAPARPSAPMLRLRQTDPHRNVFGRFLRAQDVRIDLSRTTTAHNWTRLSVVDVNFQR